MAAHAGHAAQEGEETGDESAHHIRGWDAEKEGRGRGALVGKKMLAGMEGSVESHEKREALIRQGYDADEIGQRVLNGDGGSWIKDPHDPEAIFWLDRYHIQQEILRKIGDRKAREGIRGLLEEGKPEEMLGCILTTRRA